MASCDNAGRFHVITGGPGAGKTTLLKALEANGCRCMPESGRAIIIEQVASGGAALPWADRAAFAELMLLRDQHAYTAATGFTGAVLFDRGIPDVLGYLALCGLPIPAHMKTAAAASRYNTDVFIAPPWPEIFDQDSERKQTLAEAEATYYAMVATYQRCGYRLIVLPRVSVAERVEFVMARL